VPTPRSIGTTTRIAPTLIVQIIRAYPQINWGNHGGIAPTLIVQII